MLKTAVIVSLLVSSFAVSAHAEEKVRKPVVCNTWQVLKGPKRVVALCIDGKREQILTRWVEVDAPLPMKDDPVGGQVRRVIVGWR